MNQVRLLLLLTTTLLGAIYSPAVWAQNWNLVIKDNLLDTPVNQVNGITGGTATLFATLFNFTGTSASNDGQDNPAPATSLDFAGFGWTLNPGQFDLESLFVPDPRVPGWPQVAGSTDGSTPGTSGYVMLGTFDLWGLAPGTYEEDFSAGAFTIDSNSSLVFQDVHGTLRLNVVAAPAAAVPEPGMLGSMLLVAVCAASVHRRRRICSKHFFFL